MIFTSWVFTIFLASVFAGYWLIRERKAQNILLLGASYLFYGWVHPWFCILIFSSTIIDYYCGLAIETSPSKKRLFLWVSLAFNLGLLGVFKYFNFFIDNIGAAFEAAGLPVSTPVLEVLLPVGISFYTFQTLSYTIDIYRGQLHARRSFIDFAVFVAFFPQLVAGPIERASHFIPQVEKPRCWDSSLFLSAWPLIIRGYLKKLVIADNISIYVDNIFMLQHPPLTLLAVGTLGFAIQIFCDFSAYTDIARGSARLLGFELMENFKKPYFAVSPSDFWRRWHISFSSWIRDYVYIPMGGSRTTSPWAAAGIAIAALSISGLWHGAAWHFVMWGVFHGILVAGYRALGLGGRWYPKTVIGTSAAWMIMQIFVLFGWLLFRASSLAWVWEALSHPIAGFSGEAAVAASICLVTILGYAATLLLDSALIRLRNCDRWEYTFFQWAQIAVIALFANAQPQEFIYFQF